MQKLLFKSIGTALNVSSVVAPKFTGRIGLKLFCYPHRPKLAKRYQDYLKSAVSFEFTYDGDRVFGYKWGNGSKKVLMLHGWQSHTYRWKSYIDELIKGDYTIYAFDAPGHGLSEGSFLTVPRYSDVIERVIGITEKPDIIIAHSIGSFSALFTLHRLSDLKPEKLVLLAPPGGAVEFFTFFSGMLGLSKKAVQVIRNQFMTMGYREPEYYFAPNFAEHITAEGLIIHDEHDDQTPVSNSVAINQNWKNSRLMVTKGLGHSLKSAQVLRDVLGFVGEEVVAV